MTILQGRQCYLHFTHTKNEDFKRLRNLPNITFIARGSKSSSFWSQSLVSLHCTSVSGIMFCILQSTYIHPDFEDEWIEAQTTDVMCLKSLGWRVANMGLETRCSLKKPGLSPLQNIARAARSGWLGFVRFFELPPPPCGASTPHVSLPFCCLYMIPISVLKSAFPVIIPNSIMAIPSFYVLMPQTRTQTFPLYLYLILQQILLNLPLK